MIISKKDKSIQYVGRGPVPHWLEGVERARFIELESRPCKLLVIEYEVYTVVDEDEECFLVE